MDYATKYEIFSELYDERMNSYYALEEASSNEGFLKKLWEGLKNAIMCIIKTIRRFLAKAFGDDETKRYIRFSDQQYRLVRAVTRYYTPATENLNKYITKYTRVISGAINRDYSKFVISYDEPDREIATKVSYDLEAIARVSKDMTLKNFDHRDTDECICLTFNEFVKYVPDNSAKLKNNANALIKECGEFIRSSSAHVTKLAANANNQDAVSNFKKSITNVNAINTDLVRMIAALTNIRVYCPIYKDLAKADEYDAKYDTNNRNRWTS